MDDFYKVEGSANLVKNPSTGVVLNINEEEIRIARRRKERIRQEKAEKKQLCNEVSGLKNEIAELKALIQAMADK